MKSIRSPLDIARIVSGACLIATFVIGSYWIDSKQNPPLILASLSFAFCLLTLVLLWVDFPAKLREKKKLFKQFGSDVEFGSKTVLGTVAAGKDWIGVMDFCEAPRRLRKDDIGKILWGNPSGDISQDEPGMPPSGYYKVFETNPHCFWIAVEAKNDLEDSLYLTFKKVADRDRWLGLVRTMKDPTREHKSSGLRLPGLRDWLQTTIVRNRFQFSVGAIYIYTLLLQFNGHSLLRISLQLAFYATLFPFSLNGNPMLVLISRARWERYIFGYKGELNSPLDTEIIANHVLLWPSTSGDYSKTSILIDEIANVRLEPSRVPFLERSIKDLFRKNAEPTHLSLRVGFVEPNRSDVHINLPLDRAKALYEQLTHKLESQTV